MRRKKKKKKKKNVEFMDKLSRPAKEADEKSPK